MGEREGEGGRERETAKHHAEEIGRRDQTDFEVGEVKPFGGQRQQCRLQTMPEYEQGNGQQESGHGKKGLSHGCILTMERRSSNRSVAAGIVLQK